MRVETGPAGEWAFASGVRRLSLYLETARRLRPIQWLYFPLRRVQRVLPPRQGSVAAQWAGTAELFGPVLRHWWSEAEADACRRRADEVLNGRFRFLNVDKVLDPIDWRTKHESRLWTYNLHYFDFALDLAIAFDLTGRAEYRRAFQELALDWMRQTEGGTGVGWEPYVLSLRIVNWVFALLVFGDALPAQSRDRLHDSLAMQAGALERRIEHQIQANHLVKNYLALAVAGLTFAGPAADRWRAVGMTGLWKESFTQILADGVHFERSPMYHAIVLRDFLWIIGLCRTAEWRVPAEVVARVRSMAAATGALLRPDGGPHRLQDSADGIAPGRQSLTHLAGAVLGMAIPEVEGDFSLPSAGYYGWSDPTTGERLIVDCGNPGPEFQPGHAHCTILSFEWETRGRSIVVDSGVSGYEQDPLREYVRSTRAHNTIVIDGGEQSEVWGTFRMARRARVVRASAAGTGREFEFLGAYRPCWSKSVVHERRIIRDAEREGWIIRDRIERGAGRRIASFLHFHPDFTLTRADGRFVAAEGRWRVIIEPFGHTTAAIVRGAHEPTQGWYCPEFGVAVAAPVLELVVDPYVGEALGYRIYLDRDS